MSSETVRETVKTESGTVTSPLRAGGWATASIAISYSVSALLFIPLAYFLAPSDFGLYTTAGLVFSGLSVIIDLTLVRTLVRLAGNLDDLAQAAFYLSMLVGTGGLVLCALSGLPMSFIYGEPKLVLVLVVLSPGVLAVALGTVPHALLSRELDFRRKLIPETAGVVAGAVIALVVAVLNGGVYSLLVFPVARYVINSAIAWVIVSWRPERRVPDRKTLRHLLSFGFPAIGGEIALYTRFNLDSAMTGLRLGQDALGVYAMAWTTSDRPALFLNAFFNNVSYASFSRLQEKYDYLRSLYISSTRIIASVTLPLFLVFMSVSEELVGTVFSSRWQGIISLLIPMLVLQSLWVIFYPSISVVLALGHSRLYATVNLVSLVLTFGAVWVGLSDGINGVAWGMMLAVGSTSITWGILAGYLLRLKLKQVWAMLEIPLILSVISLVAAVSAKYLSHSLKANNFIALAITGIVAVIFYATSTRFFWKKLKGDLVLTGQKLPD